MPKVTITVLNVFKSLLELSLERFRSNPADTKQSYWAAEAREVGAFVLGPFLVELILQAP